ncbi:NnrS family protein, partial [Flavobacterium croceum]|uniref:NnrS family protein n=1 Tax=Flavobacterium croceum TaxID=370975 RepID=UPI003D142EE7
MVNMPVIAPAWVIVVIDVSFIPALALTLAIPLIRSKNQRNFVFLGLLGIFFISHVVFYV